MIIIYSAWTIQIFYITWWIYWKFYQKNGACIQHLKFYMFCWIRKLTRMRNKNKYFENIIIFACSQGEHLIPRIIYWLISFQHLFYQKSTNYQQNYNIVNAYTHFSIVSQTECVMCVREITHCKYVWLFVCVSVCAYKRQMVWKCCFI